MCLVVSLPALLIFSILLAFYHKCRSLIGYTSHYSVVDGEYPMVVRGCYQNVVRLFVFFDVSVKRI